MPLQRRLPKRGFASHLRSEEVRLGDLGLVKGDKVDLASLKAVGVISIHATQAKVILAGKLERKVDVAGLRVSKGAKLAIEAAGGNVAEFKVEPKLRKLPKKEKTKS
jgi:large subunit ribosomal protein L15